MVWMWVLSFNFKSVYEWVVPSNPCRIVSELSHSELYNLIKLNLNFITIHCKSCVKIRQTCFVFGGGPIDII